MSELDPAADPVDPQNPNPTPIDPPADPPAGDPPGGDRAPKDPPEGDPDSPKGDEPSASSLPDDWREIGAGGDEDALKLLKRYGSLRNFVKSFVEKDKLIRSGKIKREMPDASDEKAIAEWRKEQGIPDDPTGYILPETVTKRMTDDDKPMLASFTEWMHSKGAPQTVIDFAPEWYFDTVEELEAQRTAADAEAAETAEEALRKDWGREYKANITLANRFMESVPGGNEWHQARLPDGRTLGAVPEFVAWASDMGRDMFGDATFANSDSERKHTARKQEIEQIMNSNIDEYYEKGLDKEYATILEKEQRRAK
ncbi:hypothetical protein [Chelativorans xinjiangense]|uniref:hypothetical protein n=1 Tax=Chelativorans xinjiangense TaxID=2681485 RepID=UPI001358BF5A|nr:hypothetical protein [Chelativorans xinjiangense]